ncbi:MAG: cell division protein ZapE [Actinomycetes bacterium]
MPKRLVDVNPIFDADELVSSLVPPPHFSTVTFDSYHPDPSQPTQGAAVAGLRAFASWLGDGQGARRRWSRRAPQPPESRPGLYLDGGFGVGKTHLLAALWNQAPEPKAFCTFVELTHLVGALGFHQAVERLSHSALLCVDEFELDDPGDTVLMSTLLGKLASAGVRLAATSNTLPDRLGEQRFAADDFLREIQGLAAHFDVLRIDGDDYRHRGPPASPMPLGDDAVRRRAAADTHATLDDFSALMDHLATVHPSRYGALLADVSVVCWTSVAPIADQAVALRLVVLTDRLYDRDVPVIASGCPLDEVFDADMLRGGYRKKYYRALSRLVALANGAG